MDGGLDQLRRERFGTARVATLATVRPDGRPHLVPIAFALDQTVGPGTLWTAVDGKPKRTTALRRLANIEHEPRVSILVDHYEDSWDGLWWVRADGRAEVVPAGSASERAGLDALVAKYEQYRSSSPSGPVIRVTVRRWASWSFR